MVNQNSLGMMAAQLAGSYPSTSPDGQSFDMVRSSGVKAKIAKIMALLQQEGLSAAERDSLVRQLAELQEQLAQEEEMMGNKQRMGPQPGQRRVW